MKIYNCLIVDDETLAQELIETHLKKIPNVKTTAKCHTAMEAISILNEQAVDIMFLDVEMPELTGIDLLRSLENPPYTILTTAYSEYALESYELNVIDYLLKPVRFDRFFKAMAKVLNALKENNNTSANKESDKNSDYIFVKSDYKALKIKFDDIVYIESMQKYVKFHLTNQKIISLMSLSSVNDLMPKNFFRCQKSFIVNLNKIEGIEGNKLLMSSNEKIPVSKSLKVELIKLIDNYNLL